MAQSPIYPWTNKCSAIPEDPASVVAVIAQAKHPEDDVIFYFPKQLLIGASDYFSAALSTEWAQGKLETVGREEDVDDDDTGLIAALEALNSEPQTAARYNLTSDLLGGTIIFQESPQAVHDLLSYIDPAHHIWILPETVDGILQIVDLVGIEDVKVACEAFLLGGKVAWDPLGALRLAERYRLRALYRSAADATLRRHFQFPDILWYGLSQATVAKLAQGRQRFFRQVALVAVKDIKGRMENKCAGCGRPLSTREHPMKQTLRAALQVEPGLVVDLLEAVRHHNGCGGPPETRTLDRIMELDDKPEGDFSELVSAASSPAASWITQTAKQFSEASGSWKLMSIVAHLLVKLEAEGVK